MELTELQSLLQDPAKLVSTIESLKPVIPEYAYNIEPENHKVVTDLQYRPWRDIEVATGLLDGDGNPTYRTEKRDVHRIPSSTQKQILDWAVRMNLSGGIEIDATIRDAFKANDETMLAMLKRTWEDNKLNYTAQKIDRLKKNYTQALVVWYSVEAEDGFWEGVAPSSKFKMRCSVFSPEDGDIITPIYNQYKEMISCARSYTVKLDGKDVEKLDLFLSDRYITYQSGVGTGGWSMEKETTIPYGKANFIFHGQKRPEYADVLPKIERVEEGDSDTADENQISSFPILAATGEITDVQGGGTKNTRKVFQLADGGDLKYVEAEGAQQSATDERKNLRRDIYDETSTPQISMEQLAGTGDIPGVAIEMMFLPATNKARSNQDGDLGMEWQRHLNLLKSCMAVINVNIKSSVSMQVKPKFKIELPRNYTEEYDNIVKLVGAGLMSKETAIKQLAFTSDPAEEYERIRAEATEAAKLLAQKAPENRPEK